MLDYAIEVEGATLDPWPSAPLTQAALPTFGNG